MLAAPPSKTPLILGAVLGPVGFLLLLLAVLFFYRRRLARARAREQLRREHELYRSSAAWHSDERGSEGSTATWSVPLAKELLYTHPTHISPALAFRATAPSSFDEVLISPPNLHTLPSFPRNSLSPNRALRATSDSKLRSDRQSEVDRAITRLQNKTNQMQSQFNSGDRDTVEGIEDEVKIIQIRLEMERLKRLLNSEWAQGLTNEIPLEL